MDCCCCTSLLVILVGTYVVWSLLLPKEWKAMVVALWRLVKMLANVKIHSRLYSGKYYSFVDVVEKNAKSHPDKVQFISVEDDRKVTIGQLDEIANQVAHWAKETGYKHGDAIALMLLSRPELVAFWLGIGKLGGATALINTNITGKALLHTVELATKSSETKIIVVDNELRDAISDDISSIEELGIKVLFWDDLFAKISKLPKTKPDVDLRNVLTERDALLYIYTSGTTGLPKASKISHSKFFLATQPFSILCELDSDSVIYNCLPLYHSAGGMLGVGSALKTMSCMVLRRKFSARAFSTDCVKYNCNIVQYIGELCRYLVNAAPNKDDERLNIDFAFGNGIRPEVWEKFQERYHIKHIVEIYASTEGNFALFNSCDRIGALGFVPRIFDFIYPIKIVKMDPEKKDSPLRDSKGHVIPCSPNEVGLMIGEIDNRRVDRRFDGYTDKEATNKKIIKNAFRDGDLYFNTGDLLSRDNIGFFYWSDRTGDTFRWKGENVATTEVANAVASVPGIEDEAVYGVEVPGCDGRAGMVAITLADGTTPENFEWETLHKEVSANLPAYARPLFVRFKAKMAITGTFKHQKGDLVKEGFDPSAVGDDPLYLYSIKTGKYSKITPEVYKDIADKKMQF